MQVLHPEYLFLFLPDASRKTNIFVSSFDKTDVWI